MILCEKNIALFHIMLYRKLTRTITMTKTIMYRITRIYLQKLLDLSNANKKNAAVGRKYLGAAQEGVVDDETRKKIDTRAKDMAIKAPHQC